MDKIKELQMKMPDTIQAVFIQDGVNRFYFSGMKSSAGTMIITKTEAIFFIDFRYIEEAERKVTNCKVVEETNLYPQIKEWLKERNIQKISVLTSYITVRKMNELKNALDTIKVEDSTEADDIVKKMRCIKDREEIYCHKKAQEITDHVFQHICNFIRPGITELEVAQEIGTMLTRLGSEDKHFNFIVASGKNSSLPHGFATNKIIENGDFVTMDFGAVYRGRLADMTRTIGVGKIDAQQKEIYEIVKEAQKRALDIIKPGVICADVDKAARDYIYEKGYKGCFSHGLGHSVGIEVHEDPRFNTICREKLVSGIVITVEPGIYIKGKYGVRIEDMVLVTEDGYKNFTKSDKELIII